MAYRIEKEGNEKYYCQPYYLQRPFIDIGWYLLPCHGAAIIDVPRVRVSR